MVDPYEAVITLAAADSGLATATGGRIAQQHRYGQDSGEWALNASALVIRPVGGLADTQWQRVQIEALCYGDTAADCGLVNEALIEWVRGFDDGQRQVVTITEGDALVYYVIARASARLINDDEIRPYGMPAFMVLLEAAVAESTV